MADINKVIRVGDTLTNIIDSVTKKSVNYRKVTTWYDGSPMTDEKVDGVLYRKKGSEYFRQIIDKDGELFLEKDTMAQMRALSFTERLFLKAGVYKGVQLNGYYSEGDTPAPIQYFISQTSSADDGGSIIGVSDIKLEHNFGGVVHMSYYGVKGDYVSLSSYTDNYQAIQGAVNNIIKGKLVFPKGTFAFTQTLQIPQLDANNSREIVFESEGRLSSGGNLSQSSSGISQLAFVGQTDSVAINSSAKQTWADFNNIILINHSGRNDVDGLVMDDYRSNEMRNFSIILFRDNLKINGDTYYTTFTKCSFTHAKRYNVFLNRLANLTTFRDCRISLSESVGLRAPQVGDGLNIDNCFIEGNKGAGLYVNNCRVLNIRGSYIENNATVGEVITGIKAQIIVGAYTNSNNTPTLINISGGNYIMTAGDGCGLLYTLHNNNPLTGNIKTYIGKNTIPAHLITKDISPTDRTHLIYMNYPAYNDVILDPNTYSYTSKTKMYYPINSRPSVMSSFYSNNDDSVTFLRPEWNRAIFSKDSDQKGLVTNKISYVAPTVLADGSNKNTAFDVDIDAPDISTVGLNIREFRVTNTTGSLLKSTYNGTNSSANSALMFQQDCKSGLFYARGGIKIGLDTVNVRVITGLAVPNGNFYADRGSIYLYQGTANTGIYLKTTDNSLNTGWELIVPMRQSAYSPDTATVAAGANPTKAEFDALLAEFRDFKNKDRASGKSATS